LNLTGELLQKCSTPVPGPGKEWEEYMETLALVEKNTKEVKSFVCYF
jgi:histone-lysine N-methyltransferase SETD3